MGELKCRIASVVDDVRFRFQVSNYHLCFSFLRDPNSCVDVLGVGYIRKVPPDMDGNPKDNWLCVAHLPFPTPVYFW